MEDQKKEKDNEASDVISVESLGSEFDLIQLSNQEGNEGVAEEDDPAHDFNLVHFSKFTFCQICGKFIYGLGKQGLTCSKCGLNCHKRCGKDSTLVCGKSSFAENSQTNVPHSLVARHFGHFVYCGCCRQFIYGVVGKQAVQCVKCGFISHHKCASKVPHNCKEVCVGGDSPQALERYLHHLVEGNVRGTCIVCKKSISSTLSLVGWSCAWCYVAVHGGCMKDARFPTPCSMGPFRTILMPPSSFVPVVNDENDDENENDYESEVGFPFRIRSPPRWCTSPLLCLVNSRSGGQLGEKIVTKLTRYLNPSQVHDLALGPPNPALSAMSLLPDNVKWNLLVCGGDGTVCWALSAIDSLKLDYLPPIAVMPLGTGNDMSRTLGWGGVWDDDCRVDTFLKKLCRCDSSCILGMDRWKCTFVEKPVSTEELEAKSERVKELDANEKAKLEAEGYEFGDDENVIGDEDVSAGITPSISAPTELVMNNYFSLGIDAKVCLKFHQMREQFPKRFKSRNRNILRYGTLGVSEMFNDQTDIADVVKIQIHDGNAMVDLPLPKGLQTLVVLNLPSYSGGSNLWGLKNRSSSVSSGSGSGSTSNEEEEVIPPPSSSNKKFSALRIDDGLFEVVGIKGVLHLTSIKLNPMKHAVRLAQTSRITISSSIDIPMQIDGEPWMQNKCSIDIQFHNRVRMLKNSTKVARYSCSCGDDENGIDPSNNADDSVSCDYEFVEIGSEEGDDEGLDAEAVEIDAADVDKDIIVE